MSRTSTLLALGAVSVVGYFLYEHGEQELAAGENTGLANFSAAIDSILGNINRPSAPPGGMASSSSIQAISPSTTSTTLSSDHDIGGSGVYMGTPQDILASARAHGIGAAEVASGAADPWGAALWSYQSGQPQALFHQQPQSVRATFDSVAVEGS